VLSSLLATLSRSESDCNSLFTEAIEAGLCSLAALGIYRRACSPELFRLESSSVHMSFSATGVISIAMPDVFGKFLSQNDMKSIQIASASALPSQETSFALTTLDESQMPLWIPEKTLPFPAPQRTSEFSVVLKNLICCFQYLI
jgi:hypothetical protein